MRLHAAITMIVLLLGAASALAQTAEPSRPLADLEARARSGDVAAMVELGDRYRTGDGVPPDLEEALTWYSEPAARSDVNANYFIGVIHLARGSDADHQRARQFLQRALQLCENETNRDTCNAMYVLHQLAIAERELALYDEALKSTRRALVMAEAAGDTAMVGNLREEMGMTHELLGLPQEALHDYAAARAAYERMEGTEGPSMGNLLLNVGNALDGLGRYAEALDAYRQSLAIIARTEGPESRTAAFLHVNIGWTLAQMKRLEEAYARSETGYDLLRRQPDKGLASTGYVLNNMGIIREWQGRHAEAITLNLRALAIYERFSDITLAPKRWALRSLANSYAATDRRDVAILFAKMAVNTHQQIRSLNAGLARGQAAALTESWRSIYQLLADLLAAEGRIAEAQHVLDLLKQQELFEFVRRDADAASVTGAATLTRAERALEDQLATAMKGPLAIAAELERLSARSATGPLSESERRRMAELENELDRSYEAFVSEVETVLTAANSDEADVRREIDALNLDYVGDRQEMLRGFPRRTVLLQAASMRDSLNLFLTTPEMSIHRRVEIGRAELARKVFDALRAIEDRSPDADRHLAELYELLVQPLAQDLADSRADVIMLNLAGFLRYLPFAALRSEHGYLVEDYGLVIDTPAARPQFVSIDRKDAAAAGFGVTRAHQGFSALPGVAAELGAIFKGEDDDGALAGVPRLDDDFTIASLKEALQQRPALLHVASHFKFVPGNETDSFLLLGDGSVLTLEHLRKTRGLRFGGVDLLTLSACETARGTDAEGDEVESFGALAQKNGAGAVMATLWPIADDASGRLMANFYRGLVDDGLDKAEALRRAQIAMLRGVAVPDTAAAGGARGVSAADDADDENMGHGDGPVTAGPDTRHPYFWAPFILMGNWL